MKKLIYFFFILFLFLSTNLIATSIVINADMTLSQKEYSNNITSGIVINNSNFGNPWEVNVSSYLKSNYNTGSHGIYSNGGKVSFIGIGSNVNFEASNNGQVGIYSKGGDIRFNNINIQTNNNNSKGIMAGSEGVITINGNGFNTLEANGNLQDGIHASSHNNSKINIEGLDISLKDNIRYGIAAQNSGAKIFIKGSSFNKNNLIVENNGIGIYAGNSGSEVEILSMNIKAKNNTLFRSDVNGAIRLDSVVIDFDDDSKLFEGTSNQGKFYAINSSLSNIINSKGLLSLENTTWKNIGKSDISELALDGINNIIYMNTSALNPSSNELLTIKNKSYGYGILYITHQGLDDIDSEHLVVDQSSVNNANANLIFDLYGGKIDDGALEYELYKGDKLGIDINSYYLRATGKVTDTSKTIENIPLISLDFISSSTEEFHKYIRNIRFDDSKNKNNFWIKNYMNYLKIDNKIKSSMHMYSLTMGYDNIVYKNKENELLLGVMLGYLFTDNIKTQSKVKDGEGDAKAPNIGVYLYWENIDGCYINSIVGNYYNKFSMTSYLSSKQSINYHVNRNFLITSINLGKKIAFNNSDFVITPNIIFTNIYANSKDFQTNQNKQVKFGQTNSFQVRTGTIISYNKGFNKSNIEPYLNLAISKEFDGYTDIVYNGYKFSGGVRDIRKEIGVGVKYKIGNSLNFYTDLNYEKSTKMESVSGSIGLSYSFYL